MAEIQISVRNKIAKSIGSPEIVCGNSDYVITFDFDAEWNDFNEKTARFIRYDLKVGQMRYTDVLFSGNAVPVPVLYDTSAVAIGVYAGDIHTTTPVRIACARCITDDAPLHDDPPPDVYAQLLDLLESLTPQPEGGGVTAGISVPILDGTVGVAGTPSFYVPNLPYIQSTGAQGVRCGFTPSSTNIRYEISFADYVPASGWSYIFGGYESNRRPGGLASSPSNHGGNLVATIGSGEQFTGDALPHFGYHEYTMEISGSTVSVLVDGIYQLTSSFSGSLDCPVALCASGNTSGVAEYGTVKIYGFKIYENDALIRDFVPALGENNRGAFYDNVSQTYFYSETGTDFIYVPAETEG